MVWFWAAALVLDFAHTLSPMALVCSHPGLRSAAMQQPYRRVVAPALAFVVTALVGLVTVFGLTSYNLGASYQLWRLTDLTNPLPLVVWAYWCWNAYHFGMQNFGLIRLLHIPGPRWLHKAIFGGGTAAVMLNCFPVGFVIGVLLISFGHWLTELWLTWRASGSWFFLPIVLLAGCSAFLWSRPTEHGLAVTFLALYICRLGLGFSHFLTDGWIWRTGVRTT